MVSINYAMKEIRRERHGKRYVMVARDNKGRILSRRRWSKKFDVIEAKRVFKEHGVFDESRYVTRHLLPGDRTRQDVYLSRPGLRFKEAKMVRRPAGRSQAVVTIEYIDQFGARRKVSAYSNNDVSHGEKIRQAEKRALSRLAEANGAGYDEDVGTEVAKSRAIGFRVGWVKFAKV